MVPAPRTGQRVIQRDGSARHQYRQPRIVPVTRKSARRQVLDKYPWNRPPAPVCQCDFNIRIFALRHHRLTNGTRAIQSRQPRKRRKIGNCYQKKKGIYRERNIRRFDNKCARQRNTGNHKPKRIAPDAIVHEEYSLRVMCGIRTSAGPIRPIGPIVLITPKLIEIDKLARVQQRSAQRDHSVRVR